MRPINLIIIHCSATPEGREVSAAEIDGWHRARGFSGIGYHYLIHLDGKTEACRPLEKIGSHCFGQNQNSIGICYVGGVDKTNKPKDTRTAEQKAALRSLVKVLLEQFPDARIAGHNEFTPNKACPCFNVREEFYGKQMAFNF